MARTQCPHCDKVIEAERFAKGQTVTCPFCSRVFLPVTMTAEPSAPGPAPAAPAAPRETREVVASLQRVRVVACGKCRALLRLSQGESKLGRCKSCGYAFVLDPKAISELVLPAPEARDLPEFELLAAGAMEQAGAEEGAATVMKTIAREAAAAPKDKIRCLLSSEAPRIRYELARDVVVVGRVGADLIINDPDVSRRHCTFERSGDRVLVRDLKSTNGTLVNGVRVELEVLKDGDRIRLGGTELRLVVMAEGEREKHVALFVDLGPGVPPGDVSQALEATSRWASEELAECKPDIILSPSTGRGMVIWKMNPLASADERRRLVPKLLAAPSSLRLELLTVPPSSGQALRPLVGMVVGMARREAISGRAKFEGPLLQKAALAVKIEGRDAVFVSDIESLEHLVGAKGPEALASSLRDVGLRAAPALPGQPFVLVNAAEALKEDMQAAAKRPAAARALRSAASTIEAELLDSLEDKCAREFEAGLALAFSGGGKAGGVFRKLTAGGKAPPEDVRVRTRCYERILGGSSIFLGKEDVKTWMELLRDIGLRYPEVIRTEREKASASKERGPEAAWEDLLRLDDASLLAAGESAILFRAALFRGQSLAEGDLQKLSRQCSEALASSVPAKYAPVPLPVLGRVYAIFKDAIDVPSDSLEPRSLFEFFVLLSLAGVTNAIADAALRRAQHFGDPQEVRAIKENYGAQIDILRKGLKTMSRIVAVLKLMPPLRAVGVAKSIFEKYKLPAYELIP